MEVVNVLVEWSDLQPQVRQRVNVFAAVSMKVILLL